MTQEPAYNYCALPLAAYACRPDQSKGRIYAEEESKHRTCFQRDRDRIIHSSAFRRLKDKTQVFIYDEGDHFRTRLTHTLEVSQITRSLARALFVNEDLAEAIALAHDLGHTPFAHLGEEAMQDCMKPYGGFDHNDQSLRILVLLEKKYPEWDGLNLTWETLEGIAKHNGPLPVENRENLSDTLKLIQSKTDLRLDTHASIEAQVAALSDDIAYNNHDVEDGLRAGMFTLDELKDLPLLEKHITAVEKKYPDLTRKMKSQEVIRRMIGDMVSDVLDESKKRLTTLPEQNPEAVRMAGMQMVEFSETMLKDVNTLRKFLYERMYKHDRLKELSREVKPILADLFALYMEKPSFLPEKWQARLLHIEDKTKRAKYICDYIAGMTDRFAIEQHKHLISGAGE